MRHFPTSDGQLHNGLISHPAETRDGAHQVVYFPPFLGASVLSEMDTVLQIWKIGPQCH